MQDLLEGQEGQDERKHQDWSHVHELQTVLNGIVTTKYGVSRDRQTWKRVLILSCRFLADEFENRVEITKFVDNFILFQENSNN